jgi:hypothetical protein
MEMRGVEWLALKAGVPGAHGGQRVLALRRRSSLVGFRAETVVFGFQGFCGPGLQAPVFVVDKDAAERIPASLPPLKHYRRRHIRNVKTRESPTDIDSASISPAR